MCTPRQKWVADLGEVVRARRVNKKLALSMLEVIAAEAALKAARWKAAVQEAQDNAKLAVAERDAALAAAQTRASFAELQMKARAWCRCAALCLNLEEGQWVGWLSNQRLLQLTIRTAAPQDQPCPCLSAVPVG